MVLSYRTADGRKKWSLEETHLKIVVEERQDDRSKWEDKEDAKGRECKLNLEHVQQGSEEDSKGVTVENRQK